jgi:hypothetical protein
MTEQPLLLVMTSALHHSLSPRRVFQACHYAFVLTLLNSKQPGLLPEDHKPIEEDAATKKFAWIVNE